MVCLVINGERLPKAEILTDMLKAALGNCLKSLQININREKTNIILGDKCAVIYGEPHITDILCNIRVRLSPLSFYQVNRASAELLYNKAAEYAAPENKTVLDLYCGAGTIGLSLADRAKRVIGVEVVPQAIEDARFNARLNGIKNAEFICADAKDAAAELESNGLKPDTVIVDPPRKGCDETLLATMIQMEPEKIVYVSCDSATLARDLKYLCGNGYEVKKCIGCDMFPMTGHVETVVLLSKGVVDKDNFRKVRVDFSLEDMDLTELRGKATYAQVKEYIFNEFGLKVSSLYIAQVKKKCGIETGENHNLPKSEDAKQPQVTPEKEEAIMKAFKHFGVI